MVCAGWSDDEVEGVMVAGVVDGGFSTEGVVACFVCIAVVDNKISP